MRTDQGESKTPAESDINFTLVAEAESWSPPSGIVSAAETDFWFAATAAAETETDAVNL